MSSSTSLMNIRYLGFGYSTLQGQRGCVGSGEQLLDGHVSHLSSSASCSRVGLHLNEMKDQSRLYPSISTVKEIPENDVDAIFDELDHRRQSQRKLSYEDVPRQRATELERKAECEPADFRQQFSRITRKSSARQTDRTNSDQDEVHDARKPCFNHYEMPDTAEATEATTYEYPDIQIEVSPGVYLPMRGAVETRQAVRQGSVRPTICVCCETQLYCIMTARYVVCPLCRVVGPVDFQHHVSLEIRGAGLGLTVEILQQEMGAC
jgi:hypothetical protein